MSKSAVFLAVRTILFFFVSLAMLVGAGTPVKTQQIRLEAAAQAAAETDFEPVFRFAVASTIIVVTLVIILLFQSLNLIDLIVNEFGHLGIAFLQHHAQEALLLQRQTLRLLLLQC